MDSFPNSLIEEFIKCKLPPQTNPSNKHSLATMYSSIKRIWDKYIKSFTGSTNGFIKYIINKC